MQNSTYIIKKHLCDPLFVSWWVNPAPHGLNLGGSGQKLTRIKIYKEFSTQLNSNPWWTRLDRGF